MMARFLPIACFLIAALFLLAPRLAKAQQSTTRQAWQYDVAAGARRLVDQGDGKWRMHFPNGTTAALTEVERTEQYIQLQHDSKRSVLRLFDDHATVQPAGRGEFRRLTSGRWVSPQQAAPAAESDYRIRVVYFVPTDREPVADYEAKIQAIVELMREIFTRDLEAKGYDTPGPQFAERNGEVAVDLVRGKRPASDYNQNGAWKSPAHSRAIFREIDQHYAPTLTTMVFAFAETYEEGPSPRLWPGHIAVAAARPPDGGVSVFSAWILRDDFAAADPEVIRRRFFDRTPIPGRTALGHRGPNSPRGDFLEDGIGGALHELGHLFGLTHHARGAESNIMSQGFRNLRWNVAPQRKARREASFSKENAAMLMASRFLNPKVDRSDNTPPTARMDVTRSGNSLQVIVEAEDDRELRLLTLVDVTEQRGRQLIAIEELSGKAQTVRLALPLDQIRGSKIQAIVVDAGGNHGRVTGP